MKDISRIRNFAIIAHIDHGKSTLADRFLELTGVVTQGSHEEQYLDRNPISRERGITIKLAPVRMMYRPKILDLSLLDKKQVNDSSNVYGLKSNNLEYILNLIDTPGHVDFSYEVDRTLASVEGVILLVDATQGIQAQTISNAYKAVEKNLVIIPVINKIDLPSAEVEKTKQQLMDFLGISKEEILYSGILSFSKKSTAVTSNGVENIIMPFFSPYSFNRVCHSHGVYDVLYKLYRVCPPHFLS